MTDPYRNPAEVPHEPPAPPTPSEPFPGPWKWRNKLWREFFDLAFGGSVGAWQAVQEAPSASWPPTAEIPNTEHALVDRAERLADEAYRRAFYAGADPARRETDGLDVVVPEIATKPVEYGPWFLARYTERALTEWTDADRAARNLDLKVLETGDRTELRFVIREDKTNGRWEYARLRTDAPALFSSPILMSEASARATFEPIRPVLVDEFPDATTLVWTQKDCEEAAISADKRGAYGTADSHARRAAFLRSVPMPPW